MMTIAELIAILQSIPNSDSKIHIEPIGTGGKMILFADGFKDRPIFQFMLHGSFDQSEGENTFDKSFGQPVLMRIPHKEESA